ncbi:GNAT family N-acetyltransferase [Porticoccus sp. W117]|uniref:GNAT family N-acetyltransferase n=1 Tax=Porticoccus sp. W117 TaxID=3054777 RepID=UPI0025959B29|nr:GNAT family N-acetyltransferase [Porticoccus sp. W117]MDM3871823.1 GNAT family N-acetyltransferase [Porticoccus sp. W117]
MNIKAMIGHCYSVKHGSEAYDNAVQLRYEVLRKPQGLSFSDAELEAEADSGHLVCELGGKIAGCLVLAPWQQDGVKLRQMAVAPEYRGCTIGSQLVQAAEKWAGEHGCSKIVLHARTSAEGFYKKLGFSASGEVFMEVGLPHRVMRKALNG